MKLLRNGSSNYNSLQVSLVRHAAQGHHHAVLLHVFPLPGYRLRIVRIGRRRDGQLDPYDQRYDYGNCGFDLRHNLVGNVIYQLPFHGNRLVEGWQVSGIFTAQTGTPFSISDGFDQAGLFNNVASTRPDVTPGCNPVREEASPHPFPGIVTSPTGSTLRLLHARTRRHAGRRQEETTLVGPRFINLDFRLAEEHKNHRAAPSTVPRGVLQHREPHGFRHRRMPACSPPCVRPELLVASLLLAEAMVVRSLEALTALLPPRSPTASGRSSSR